MHRDTATTAKECLSLNNSLSWPCSYSTMQLRDQHTWSQFSQSFLHPTLHPPPRSISLSCLQADVHNIPPVQPWSPFTLTGGPSVSYQISPITSSIGSIYKLSSNLKHPCSNQVPMISAFLLPLPRSSFHTFLCGASFLSFQDEFRNSFLCQAAGS